MKLMAAVRALFGRDELPEGFAGRLDPDEHVLASAAVSASAGGGPLVVSSWGVWLPGGRRIGWHLVSKAIWDGGALTVVEAEERQAGADGGEADAGAVLLADRAPLRLPLAEPGRVPQVVQERVTASIRSRHHRELPGGGAWFVRRKVPGRDGVLLQVRPDPGTDEQALRRVVSEVAGALRQVRASSGQDSSSAELGEL